jgi:hypothetical protein
MQKSWDGYITALGAQRNPSTTIDTGIPFPTSGGPDSGFLELRPKTDSLKKYDAMNPEWEGIKPSNSTTDMYKPEFQSIQNGFNQSN